MRISGFVVAAAVGIVLSLAGLVTFVSLGVHSVGCRDRKKLNDQAPSKTTSLRARRMSSQDTTSPSVPPLMPPLVTPPSSWPPPPLGPPVAPEQCPESMVSCADLASLTDVWQALGSELRDSGSVGLWRFMDAVNQMSSVAPDSPFLKQVLSQDMDIRTRAINNSLWKDDDSSGLPVIPASEHPSITLHDFLQRFPDRDYSLNTLMWVFRNVVLNCILISEVVINDNYAADNLGPAYATFLLTATEDTDLTNKFYLQSASTTASTLNKSLVVNGLCSLPATCAPKLRLRAAEAMASILSVSIPLKQHVDDEWTSDGHTGQFPSTCNHAMCCTGVGIFPPPAPPAPPPAPPSPSSPPPPPTPPPFPPHDSGAESCPVCECRAANAGPSSARCGGSGLTGFDCHRCGTDAGCSRFMGVSGRCDDGVVAAAWAKGETHKGLDCLAGGDLARASASCRVRGSEQGWNDQGRASGNCTVGVQVGEGIFLSCFADGCAFRTGESSVVCDQVQCDEDLSGGRQTDVAAKAYAESVSGRVAVDCNVRTDGSAVCELDVGSLPVAIQAEGTASRCMDASRARPSPQTVLARLGEKSVEELCKDEARSLFPPLSIAATLFSVGIVLLFSACGYRKSLSRMQAASDTQKAARLASWMSPKDTHQKTASGSEHPSADGAVIPDLQRPQDTVPSLDRLAELVQQLRRVDDAPILGWTRLSVNVVDGVCANRAPRPESGIRGAVLGLHWKRVGVSKPAMCTVLSHEALAVALATKTEFTQAEFDSLKVPPLRSDNCILVRGEYFRPAGAPRRAVVEECSAELCLSNGDQGAVTALMGPSGSGKTSLLHAVTGIPTAGLRQRGDVHLGGVSVTTLPRGIISLVPQDAVLPEELCAREALMFASALSLPSAPLKDRSAIVDETLSNLLLRDVASHTIGGRLAGGGGLSGGERKRVSIGLSIVTCPQVLLLDEPSSGLDAYTAFLLGDLIKKLAEKSKRVVLVSVHQPSSQLFELFHGLLLLAEGKCIYHGPPLDAVPSLSRATSHFPPQPEGIAPADHLLHVLVRHLDRVCPVEPIKSRGSERSNSYSRMKRMSVSVVVLGRPSVNPHRFSWPRQCYWLGWRCIVQLCREPSLLLTQMVVHVGVALLMGYAFLQVESDIAGFQNKAGSISFMLYFFAIGGLSTAQTVTREWPLLWAEYHEGLYSAVPYAVTRLLIEVVLLRVLPSVAFSGIFYALAGFRREFVALVRFLFAAALASADSALVSAAISVCLPRRPGAASMISVVVLFMFLLVSGLQINLNKVPDGLRWLPAISFGRHAFEIMLSTELDGEDVRVEVPGAPPVDVKADIVLGVIGLNASRTSQNFLALCAIGVILVALTSGVLVLQMEPWLNHVRKTQAEAATRRSLEPPSLSRSATSASVVSAVSEESHVRGVSLSLEEAGISVSLDEDASLLLEEPAHDEDAPAKEARAAASEPLFSLSLEQRAAVLLEEPAYESAVLPVE